MAKIPFNPAMQPVRAEVAPKVGADFGTANLRAQEQQAGAVKQISMQAGAIATDYAVKNKSADMQADEMNYRAKKLEVMNATRLAASQTSDSAEIKKIYKNAQNDIQKWVDSNDANGNPNIRWKDQVAGIRGDASQFRVELDGAKAERLAGLSEATTIARSDNAYKTAINNFDLEGAKSAIQILVGAGKLTPEVGQIKAEQAEAEIRKRNVSEYVIGMQAAVNAGDFDLFKSNAEAMGEAGAWDSVKIATEIGEFEPKVNAGDMRMLVSESQKQFAIDGNTKEYIERLDQISSSMKDIDLTVSSRNSIQTEINYKQSHAIGSENKKMAKTVETTVAKLFDGSFTHADYIKASSELNPRFVKNLSDGLEDTLKNKAVTDAQARKAATIAEEAASGKISWEKAWKDLAVMPSELKQIASIVVADNYMEAVAKGKQIFAYDGMWGKDVKTESTGDMRDIIERIGYFSKSANAAFVVSAMEDSIAWKTDGMYKGEKLTKEEFMSKRFNSVAKDTAAQAPVPQVQAKRELTEADQQALDWANANPNDPRAVKIKSKLGVK